MTYHHLTQKEREKIYLLKQEGMNQEEIAEKIGISQPTVSRELARNRASPELGYLPDSAQEQAKGRRSKAKSELLSWYDHPPLIHYVTEKLTGKEHWSPEQISGRLKKDFKDKKMRVSHEAIYQYIWGDKKKEGTLHKSLRNQGKRNRKRGHKEARGIIPNRRDISERPKEAEGKKVVGHSESDLIIGLQTSQNALLTIVDRKIKRLSGGRVRRTAKGVADYTIRIMNAFPPALRKTMTHDNGKEISSHEEITGETGMLVYCARAYHSWERGLNEFTNRLVRQYFPKGTDFDIITDAEVQEVFQAINNRPRKCLNYHTPNEMLAIELERLCTSG